MVQKIPKLNTNQSFGRSLALQSFKTQLNHLLSPPQNRKAHTYNGSRCLSLAHNILVQVLNYSADFSQMGPSTAPVHLET